MQGQNLFLTTDKYSAVSFGFDKNTWSLYKDGKTFVLSVSPKYSYDFLYDAMEGIDDDRVASIIEAVIGDRIELLSADEYCFILDDGKKTLDCGKDGRNPSFFATIQTEQEERYPERKGEEWRQLLTFRML